jgi:hypothetical protein
MKKPITFAARMLLLPFVVLFSYTFCGTGCSTIKDEAKATAKTVIDCTKAEAVEAIAQYSPAVEQVFVDAIDGQGKLDKERVKAATKSFATDTAKCVLAQTIARLLTPPTETSGAPQSSPLLVDLVGLQELRKEQLGELRYKLPGGGTL